MLVAAHDDNGALGLILNRPLDVRLADVSPALDALAEPGSTLHRGGPVAPGLGGRARRLPRPLARGADGLRHRRLPERRLRPRRARGRACAARACSPATPGWGPGQLDEELEEDGWIVGQLAPDELWQTDTHAAVVDRAARKGGSYALLARMPEDPSVN